MIPGNAIRSFATRFLTQPQVCSRASGLVQQTPREPPAAVNSSSSEPWLLPIFWQVCGQFRQGVEGVPRAPAASGATSCFRSPPARGYGGTGADPPLESNKRRPDLPPFTAQARWKAPCSFPSQRPVHLLTPQCCFDSAQNEPKAPSPPAPSIVRESGSVLPSPVEEFALRAKDGEASLPVSFLFVSRSTMTSDPCGPFRRAQVSGEASNEPRAVPAEERLAALLLWQLGACYSGR